MAKSKSRQTNPEPLRPAKPAVLSLAPQRPDWAALGNRFALPLLGVCLLLAFGLRILHLDTLSLWVDEYVHVLRARDVVSGQGALFTSDNNGILLTTLLLPVFKVFGATAFAARFISVLFGLGTIYLMYKIGARLFNRYVGLLAAFSGTVSLYLIFWSRIARNYAIFGFFSLLLGYVFIKAVDNPIRPDASDFWERHGLSKKYSLLFPLVLAGAFLSHQLTFLDAFSIGTFALLVAGGKWLRQRADRFNNVFLWLGLALLPVMLLAMPGLNQVFRGPLAVLLSEQQLDWILPKWSRLAELWAKQPWTAFQMYHGVLRYDPALLYYPAVAGIGVAFWLRPRSGAWLFSALVVPFFLLSFLFQEPSLPRYFVFVFPYFLLAAAVFFYGFFQYLTSIRYPGMPNWARYVLLFLPFVLVGSNARWPEIKRLVLAEQREGHVVNNNISQVNFTNWKQPTEFVNKRRKPDDVLMSTVTTAASYYLNVDEVLWFRQMQYDTKLKKYVSNPAETNKRYSAATYEDLVRTVQQSPRGWLLADYYMDNVFVDARARMFVHQNMHFYPEASSDGSVMVFGWDRDRPPPKEQNIVVQLGKAADKVTSPVFFLQVPEQEFQEPTMELVVRRQNVNSNREGLIILNDDNAVYLPPNQGRGVETEILSIQKEWLKPGSNKIQIIYEEKVKSDPDKGFTVYYVAVD
jgi:4-amino-4-deoxy-L-arabinose transferase-like glycosyltransferase